MVLLNILIKFYVFLMYAQLVDFKIIVLAANWKNEIFHWHMRRVADSFHVCYAQMQTPVRTL